MCFFLQRVQFAVPIILDDDLKMYDIILYSTVQVGFGPFYTLMNNQQQRALDQC